MSMKRLAILSAVQTAQHVQNGTTVQTSSSSSSASSSSSSSSSYSSSSSSSFSSLSGVGTYVIPGYNMSGNAGPGVGVGGGGGFGVGLGVGAGGTAGRYETDLHGNVNILLGGAMLSGVVIVVVLVCYCCHRNIRKHQPQEYSQYWRAEPDVHSLEVFTMDSHAMQCYERAGIAMEEGMLGVVPRPVTPGPPPAYESLIFKPHQGSGMLASPSEKKESPTTPAGNRLPLGVVERGGGTGLAKEEESRQEDEEGLPSYEAALKLEANGYV